MVPHNPELPRLSCLNFRPVVGLGMTVVFLWSRGDKDVLVGKSVISVDDDVVDDVRSGVVGETVVGNLVHSGYVLSLWLVCRVHPRVVESVVCIVDDMFVDDPPRYERENRTSLLGVVLAARYEVVESVVCIVDDIIVDDPPRYEPGD